MEDYQEIEEIFGDYNFDFDKTAFHLQSSNLSSQNELKGALKNKIEKIENYQEFLKKNKATYSFKYLILCKIVIFMLRFHLRVAYCNFSYLVLPFVEIGRISFKYEDLNKIKELAIHKLKEESSLKDDPETLFIIFQICLMQQEKNQASCFLKKLNDWTNNINMNQRNQETIQSKKILQFQESILTCKVVMNISNDDVNGLSEMIELLQKYHKDIYGEQSNEQNTSQEQIIIKRKQNNITFFKMYQSYLEDKQVLSQTYADKLAKEKDHYLLVLYHFQQTQNLAYIKSLYSNLFDKDLFDIFDLIQQYEQSENKKLINQMCQKFESYQQRTDYIYKYGDGKFCFLLQLLASLYRILKHNNEAKKMQEKFQLIELNFSTPIKNFLKFHYALTIYNEQTSTPIQSKYQKSEFDKTNFSILEKGVFEDKEYILKKPQVGISQQNFRIEACLSVVFPRYFLHISDSYLDTDGNLVNVYKRQGKDLQEYLKNNKIDLMQKLYFVLQVINGMSSSHQNNIAHNDIKLNNILLKQDDAQEIFIIDLNIAKINIFNLFFKPHGYNQNSPNEQKLNKNCTLKTDIHSISKLIVEMLEKEEYHNDKNELLFPQQMRDLIKEMQNEKQLERKNIVEVQFRFRIYVLITLIFKQLNLKYEDYQQFYNFLYESLDYFLNDICYFIENKQVDQSLILEKNSVDFKKIGQALYQICEKKDCRSFFDCVKDQKLKNFVNKILELYEDLPNKNNFNSKVGDFIIQESQEIGQQKTLFDQKLESMELKHQKQKGDQDNKNKQQEEEKKQNSEDQMNIYEDYSYLENTQKNQEGYEKQFKVLIETFKSCLESLKDQSKSQNQQQTHTQIPNPHDYLNQPNHYEFNNQIQQLEFTQNLLSINQSLKSQSS